MSVSLPNPGAAALAYAAACFQNPPNVQQFEELLSINVFASYTYVNGIDKQTFVTSTKEEVCNLFKAILFDVTKDFRVGTTKVDFIIGNEASLLLNVHATKTPESGFGGKYNINHSCDFTVIYEGNRWKISRIVIFELLEKDIAVRHANSNDLQAIHRLAHDNFDNAHVHGYCTQQTVTCNKARFSMDAMQQIAKEQRRGKRIILVAEFNSKVVGVASLVENNVRMVFVKLGMQQQGIGKALLNEIEKMATEHGISELTVASTVNAVGFYEKKGFGRIGKDKGALLRKPLAA